MSVEVLPVGITCNLKCDYCYENSLRDANPVNRYNRDAVLKTLDKLPDQWSLFGGEALILPLPQLEELLKLGFDKWKRTGVQTNGSLITDKHIELFIKYHTHVGISLDGPDELNDSRWAGTLEATRKQTEKTLIAIDKLAEISKKHPQVGPSIILTLHRGNCGADVFPKFVAWLKELDKKGLTTVNLHVMELDSKADKWYLSQDELSDRLIDLWNLQNELEHIDFVKFREVLALLEGDDNVTCTWHACDPLNTGAVQSVDNEGEPSLCARTFKGDHRWLPAEGSGYNAPLIGHPGTRLHIRQLALYVTPQEDGGCKDCEFWMMCKGQCPGEGDKGDWRNRSHYCLTWKKLFAEGARRLRTIGKKPVPDWPHRKHLESIMYDMWVAQKDISLGALTKQHKECTSKGMVPVKGGYHGDSDATAQ